MISGKLFDYEALFVEYVRQAFRGLARYPDFITHFGDGNFEQGMPALNAMAQGLWAESQYWYAWPQEYDVFLDQWVAAHASRMGDVPDV